MTDDQVTKLDLRAGDVIVVTPGRVARETMTAAEYNASLCLTLRGHDVGIMVNWSDDSHLKVMRDGETVQEVGGTPDHSVATSEDVEVQ